MKAVWKALAAMAVAGAAMPAGPALAGERQHGWGANDVYFIEHRGPYDRLGTRIHRTAIEDGFFGQGARSDGRGHYDYDRGYPYDYYSEDSWEESDEVELAEPRETRCDTEWVRDEQQRDRVPVTICRG